MNQNNQGRGRKQIETNYIGCGIAIILAVLAICIVFIIHVIKTI